jgi:putative nucleotidyltransferase with HDIG domain
MSNKEISDSEKADMLYEVSSEVINDIFEKPTDAVSLNRGSRIVNVLSKEIINNQIFFYEMLDSLKFNKTLYSHSINVAAYTINFLKHLNIKELDVIENVGFAAFLHDIGKIELDYELINKDGSLTEQEWEKIKKHTELGLKKIVKFFPENKLLQNIIMHHHEYIDGSGYPAGLKGEDVSIEIQVVSIANIFENLRNRENLNAFRAFERIKEYKDKGKFDRKLYSSFVKLFSGLDKIKSYNIKLIEDDNTDILK